MHGYVELSVCVCVCTCIQSYNRYSHSSVDQLENNTKMFISHRRSHDRVCECPFHECRFYEANYNIIDVQVSSAPHVRVRVAIGV